jgi:hypothetical protein
MRLLALLSGVDEKGRRWERAPAIAGFWEVLDPRKSRTAVLGIMLALCIL